MYGQPLPIRRFILPGQEMPLFTAHKTLFYCMLSRNQTIDKDVPLPLISDQRLQHLHQLVGANLKTGWQVIEKMMDYRPLRQLKAQALTQCISSEAVFDFLHSCKRGSKEKPFVGFAGIMVSVMRMPLDVENTVVVHTWIENNSHIRLMRGQERDHLQGEDDANAASHHRNNLMRLLLQPQGEQEQASDVVDSLLDGDEPTIQKQVFEREKHFKFSRVTFGKHTLIPMSELNAVDSHGRDLKVLTRYDFPSKHARDEWLGRRYSEVWAHAALVNQTRIVTAVRSKEATVVHMSVTDADTRSMMQEMERMLQSSAGGGGQGAKQPLIKRAKWDPRDLYDFLDRFLTSVQQELHAAPTGRVVSYLFKKNRTRELTPLVQTVGSSIAIKRIGGSIRPPFSPRSGAAYNPVPQSRTLRTSSNRNNQFQRHF